MHLTKKQLYLITNLTIYNQLFKGVLNMLSLHFRKILKKGYPDGSGFVNYVATLEYSPITIFTINEVLREIQKDFPKATDEQVSVKSNDKEVIFTFFTSDLPPKNSGFFDEEHYVFD